MCSLETLLVPPSRCHILGDGDPCFEISKWHWVLPFEERCCMVLSRIHLGKFVLFIWMSVLIILLYRRHWRRGEEREENLELCLGISLLALKERVQHRMIIHETLVIS